MKGTQFAQLITGAIFMIATIILYSVFTVILCKKKYEQPVKSRFPALLLASLFGNALSSFSLSIVLAFGNFFDEGEKGGLTNDSEVVFIGLLVSEVIGMPLMLCPHILRATQLLNIFQIDVPAESRTKEQLRLENYDRRPNIQQAYYMKWAGATFSVFFVGAGVLIALFVIYQEYLEKSGIYLRDFVTMMVTMALNFVLPAVLAACGIRLLGVRCREISMKLEILILCSICFISTGTFHVILHYFFYSTRYFRIPPNDLEITELVVIVFSSSVLLIRNFVSFGISIVFPILRNKIKYVMPFGETRDCVQCVEIALAAELPYLYFSRFLKQQYGSSRMNLLTLYTQIKIFQDRAEFSSSSTTRNLFRQIIRDFLIKDAKFGVEDIDSKLKDTICEQLKEHSREVNGNIFAPIYGTILKKLKESYEVFKKSGLFDILYQELKDNEIIFERLQEAELL